MPFMRMNKFTANRLNFWKIKYNRGHLLSTSLSRMYQRFGVHCVCDSVSLKSKFVQKFQIYTNYGTKIPCYFKNTCISWRRILDLWLSWYAVSFQHLNLQRRVDSLILELYNPYCSARYFIMYSSHVHCPKLLSKIPTTCSCLAL